MNSEQAFAFIASVLKASDPLSVINKRRREVGSAEISEGELNREMEANALMYMMLASADSQAKRAAQGQTPLVIDHDALGVALALVGDLPAESPKRRRRGLFRR